MLPQSNVAHRRVFAAHDVRRQNPPVLPHFLRKIGIPPTLRQLPNRSFDSRRLGTSFHVEAAPLGRDAARDAAGRAGSLRGPAASFYAPLQRLSRDFLPWPLSQKQLTDRFFIDSRDHTVYKLSNRPQCAAPVRAPLGPFLSLKNAFFGATS